MKKQVSDEDAAFFVKSLVDKLHRGSKIALDVTAHARNKFTLCVVFDGRNHKVQITDARARRFDYPREIPVAGLQAITEKMYPKFMLKPGVYSIEDLSGIYGVPEADTFRCIYEALARRINAKDISVVISDWVKGLGYVTRGEVKLGRSVSEAELRLAI